LSIPLRWISTGLCTGSRCVNGVSPEALIVCPGWVWYLWIQVSPAPASLAERHDLQHVLSQNPTPIHFCSLLRHFIVCLCPGVSSLQIEELTSAHAADAFLVAHCRLVESLELDPDPEIAPKIRTYVLSILLFSACQLNELFQGTLQHPHYAGRLWVIYTTSMPSEWECECILVHMHCHVVVMTSNQTMVMMEC
jgi:hypothetical protein